MKNLLVIDDDEVDLEHVSRMMQKSLLACKLWIARNGIEALDQLRKGLVPKEQLVVLLDLNMPKMSGLDCLRALRQDVALRELRVVVLTTSSDDGDLRAAKELGAASYLLKPIELAAFTQMLHGI